MSERSMTEEEKYLFDLNGFLVIENALTPQEVSALNAIIDARPSWEDQAGSKHVHTGMDEEYLQNNPSDSALGLVNIFSGLLLDWGEPFRQLVGHNSILPFVLELVGDTARLDHQYAIFMKRLEGPAGSLSLHGGGTPYSRSEYYHFRDGQFHNGLIVVSFALTDAPPGAGGFCCLPGSHKSNLPLPYRFRYLPEPVKYVVQVPVRAGDAIIFTEALSHGTMNWGADHERRVLLYKYCPGHMQWERGSPYTSIEYNWTPIQTRLLRPPYFGRRKPVVKE